MKEYDMNGFVRIKLNDNGKYIANNEIAKMDIIEWDEDGYTTMQLWKVMKVFGPFLPEINPFEEMTMVLDENYIFESDKKTK